MIDTGTLDLRGTRTVPFSQTINFRGMDFTGAAAIGVVLQRWDAPTATIALPAGPSAGATGVTIGAPFTAGGVVHTPVTIFISLADMLSIPDAAEAGGDLELVWYLTIEPLGGLKARYLEGTFYIGGPQSGHGSPSPTLVTIEDTTVTVTVGGSDATEPLAIENSDEPGSLRSKITSPAR